MSKYEYSKQSNLKSNSLGQLNRQQKRSPSQIRSQMLSPQNYCMTQDKQFYSSNNTKLDYARAVTYSENAETHKNNLTILNKQNTGNIMHSSKTFSHSNKIPNITYHDYNYSSSPHQKQKSVYSIQLCVSSLNKKLQHQSNIFNGELENFRDELVGNQGKINKKGEEGQHEICLLLKQIEGLQKGIGSKDSYCQSSTAESSSCVSTFLNRISSQLLPIKQSLVADRNQQQQCLQPVRGALTEDLPARLAQQSRSATRQLMDIIAYGENLLEQLQALLPGCSNTFLDGLDQKAIIMDQQLNNKIQQICHIGRTQDAIVSSLIQKLIYKMSYL